MKVLITGGAGFIGSNFVKMVNKVRPEWDLAVVDNMSIGSNPENLKGTKHRMYNVDIRSADNLKAVFQEEKPELIVHFAAQSHVDRSIESPMEFTEVNVLGTHNLLELALEYKCRFHHVSTDEVYGTLKLGDKSWNEDCPHRPSSPYSASKSASDMLVHSYFKTFGLFTTTSNCSNNYGIQQYEEKFLPKFIRSIIRGEKFGIYGNGKQIRDWIHVDDHNRALISIIEGGISGKSYNIGAHNEHSNLDMVNKITGLLAMDGEIAKHIKEYHGVELQHPIIEFITDRKGHDFRYSVDSSRLQSEFGWKVETIFHEAFADVVFWYANKFAKEIKNGR